MMRAERTISVSFIGGVKLSELREFVQETADMSGDTRLSATYDRGDPREPDTLTLRASAPLGQGPNMPPDSGGPC